ncbi:MAG TPA: hypothetical protein VFC99_00145 [Acidimicrobiia bacterium]|nr:hypothetical protein [Acidimicrobiia bacterium]
MGRPDPSDGRLALAPPAPPPAPARSRRPGPRGPAQPPPSGPASYGRRRLLVVAIVVTVAAVAYLAATSFGGGGGGGDEDAYLRANHRIAAEGRAILASGNDLRRLRDIGKFQDAVDASVAAIGAQVTALGRVGASGSAHDRSIVRDTIVSGEQIAQLGTTFARDVTKGDLGAANRDEASIDGRLIELARQSDAWRKRS